MSADGTTLRFLGAAETVTGSRYLMESGGARVLVDCGLFQGYKKLRERNWAEPLFDPARLDAVVLTHAHIDHSGYLPRLCKLGFAGRIYCTSGTRDLLRILLPDSGSLQEEEAKRANKWGYTKHHPAEPLYTRDDAEQCLVQLTPIPFYESFEPAAGLTASFTRAGHILGSACVMLRTHDTSVLFSGDVGRPAEDVPAALAKLVNETVAKNGVILVPAFAVGRAQHLLHLVAGLLRDSRIPNLPVFLDSPMSIDATGVFCEHKLDHRVPEDACRRMCQVAQYSQTPDDSKAIDRRAGPMIVISASGMATGGRILHHLSRFLPDERNAVLFVGYQAAGTRGRALVDGTDELKIFGQYVPVRARIVQVEGLSAHADYAEILDWLRSGKLTPKRAFVTHGEPSAADALRRRLHDAFSWDALVPEDGSTWKLQ